MTQSTWRQPPTSHPQAPYKRVAWELLRRKYGILALRIPYLRWSAWLVTGLLGAWERLVVRLRPGSKDFSPSEGVRIGDGIGRSTGAGRIEGIVCRDGTKERGEKAENGVRARLTQVSHDPHQTLVNRASDFLGTTKSPRFPVPALALQGNPQSASHSGSVALRHSEINKALTLTSVYSPYNEHSENTTVDYQGLTKEKWRKPLLIDG